MEGYIVSLEQEENVYFQNPAGSPNTYVWMSFPTLNISLIYVLKHSQSVILDAHISNAVIGFLQSSGPN